MKPGKKVAFKAFGRNSVKRKLRQRKYLLNLYVAGTTPQSLKAINNVRKMCQDYLQDACELKIIDIYQQPLFAKEGQIVAAPTLIKTLPLPLKRFIGDMSNLERILVGLDVRKKTAE